MTGIVLCAGIVGCSTEVAEMPHASTTTPSASTSTPTSTPTSTTTPPSQEDLILAAVDGYWAALLSANDPPDANHPDLHQYLMGEALETAQSNIRSRIERGLKIVLPPNSVAGITSSIDSIGDGMARVLACVVDDAVQVEAESSVVANDDSVTYLTLLALRYEGGRWRVMGNDVQEKWLGEKTCRGKL